MASNKQKEIIRQVFTRKEYKYRVPDYLLTQTIDYFSSRLEPDPFNKGLKPYTVRSVYFDSISFKHYEEKIHGNEKRKKIRLRTYGDHKPKDPVFLEIKHKKGDIIFKERVLLKDNLNEFLTDFRFRTLMDYDTPVVQKCFIDQKRYNIGPRVLVLYKRIAFLDKRIGFKVNMDFDISGNLTSDLLAPEENAAPLYKNRFVLEIKYDKIIPSYFMNFITSNALERTPYSKYAASLESTYKR